MKELRDLYDIDSNKTDKTYFKGDIIPDGYYPMVVIRNSDGNFLMQKRVEEKGGDWGVTGGHPKSGETPLEGIVTEVKEEINKENDNLEKEIKSLESKANYKNIDFKDMIKQLKKKLSKKIDYNSELTEELLDLYVSKIIVHKDHFDWKLNYLSDKIESDDEDNYNGIFLTRILITREDIIKFNEKKHCLKKVIQKDPIIMDIYI